jgi:crotonobetainyl-CoA:carnitine CoA-transferase CaiB-like acyl-CoA transferase
VTLHTQDRHDLPLAGVRVLDFTRILSGPYCTLFLAELGAEIIKIERPTVGDDTRSWGPPFVDDDDNISSYFAALNRGKRSVTLDFTDPRGGSIVRRLAAECDVVVENFRPGVARRYGLDFQQLAEANPALVTLSISGFGSTGPYADYPGTEIVVEGMSGLMSVTGARNGEPVRFGIAMTDIATGLTAAGQIVAALGVARNTGVGTHIDTSLYATAIAALGTLVASASISGDVPGRWGSHHPSIVPYGGFPTADGDIITGTVNDRMWPTLCRAIGAEHLLADSELATNAGRVRQRDRVEAAIARATATFTTGGLVQKLLGAGLLAAPIRTVSEMLEDPATRELGLLTSTEEYPDLLTTRLTGAGIDAGTQQVPVVGADTTTVLTELAGVDPAHLDELRHANIV